MGPREAVETSFWTHRTIVQLHWDTQQSIPPKPRRRTGSCGCQDDVRIAAPTACSLPGELSCSGSRRYWPGLRIRVCQSSHVDAEAEAHLSALHGSYRQQGGLI